MSICGVKIKIVNKFRFLIFLSVSVILISYIFMLFFNIVSGDEIERYTNYYVDKGDTLWSIANTITDENIDIREAVYDITQLNNLSESIYIYPGQQLLLPVYND